MPFHTADSVRYFTFNLLTMPGLTHAVFTRRGGVSPWPWAELNLGGTVGDEPSRVAANREKACHSIGRSVDSLFDVWQVHSNQVVSVTAPRPVDQPHQQADAMLTDRPGVTLLMRFADCVPILLYDPLKGVIGLLHAGWLGTVRKVASCAVHAMQDRYGSRPGDILAAIGPAIGAHHYRVGPEVIEQFNLVFGPQAEQFFQPADMQGAYLDLWAANRFLLESAGVRQLEIAGICTACHLDDWYSHRAESGNNPVHTTGRFGVMIGLN